MEWLIFSLWIFVFPEYVNSITEYTIHIIYRKNDTEYHTHNGLIIPTL